MKVAFKILIFILSRRLYIIIKTLFTIRQVKLIRKKEFIVVVLYINDEIFLIIP